LCPGNVREVPGPKPGAEITAGQITVTFLFLAAIASVGRLIPTETHATGSAAANDSDFVEQRQDTGTADRCKVPDWAVAIGHAEKWKLHNNCKTAGAPSADAGAAQAVGQPTVEIIAMAHPPVQSALKPLREWLGRQGGRLRVVEIDAESEAGERRLKSAGLEGHIPIAILIDGKHRIQRTDGSMAEFVNFPAAAGNPMGFNGTWMAVDFESTLLARMK
jgi:hypothetical protein